MSYRLILVLIFLLQVSCFSQTPSNVLVVANSNNTNSVVLANTYMSARNIPNTNYLSLQYDPNDNSYTISLSDFTTNILNPILNKINTISTRIDYIVLCRNLPYLITNGSLSVDNLIASKGSQQINNPYYTKTTVFNSATYNMYIVTRLDGLSWEDATALITRASSPISAPFYYDCDPTKDSNSGYRFYNTLMRLASSLMNSKGKANTLENTNTFGLPSAPVGLYISWGSNDAHYNATTYNSIPFARGCVAETAVSTSASNLRVPGGTQSQIATFVHNGVTGVSGYVAEPYVASCERPDTMSTNYLAGRTLGETFFSSSRLIGWRGLVVGDPLCAPYKK